MRSRWMILAALALAASGAAARPGTPAPPRPRGAGAKVMFAADFQRGADGWTLEDPSFWSSSGGTLCAALPDKKQVHSIARAGSPEWTDYALDLDLCGMRGVDRGAAVRVDDKKGIAVDLRGPPYDDVLLHSDRSELGRARVSNANRRWHHLRIEARGHRYRVLVDGRLVLDRRDPEHAHPRGGIALAGYTGGAGACQVCFANVRVTALR